MHIVTDRGADLTDEQLAGLNVHFVPLIVNLGGSPYRSGEDIQADEFYRRMSEEDLYPTTSLPSAGDFGSLYQQITQDSDREVLSIHLSSGLSGTLGAAKLGADMAPDARVTIWDSLSLSGGLGWQVESAAHAAKAGWPIERILELLQRIRSGTEVLCALPELKYLVRSGRISHLKGLIASVLRIKPVIGVEKDRGSFVIKGRARAFHHTLEAVVAQVLRDHAPGSRLRVQLMHTANPEAAETLRALLDQAFRCHWLPTGRMGPVLGAHAGPSIVGLAYAAQELFDDLPWENEFGSDGQGGSR
jgi:DegV family protein with EDD domain